MNNMELRWVERPVPIGPDASRLVRTLQYREKLPSTMRVVQQAPVLTIEPCEGGWSEWTDVPVEEES